MINISNITLMFSEYIDNNNQILWLKSNEASNYYDDTIYRNNVDSFILNNQLKLKLTIEQRWNCYYYRNTITDCNVLKNVNILELNHCDNVINVFTLNKIYSLNLCKCNNIDVNALSTIRELYISDCEYIKNICMLTQIHYLELSYCKNIVTNISMFYSIHTLDISYYKGITDVDNNTLRLLYFFGNTHNIYGYHLSKNLCRIGTYNDIKNHVKKLNKYKKNKYISNCLIGIFYFHNFK